MHTTALQYKLIKKVKDERFDEDLIHQYALLINLGTRDFQIGVVDSQDHRILLLEDYVLPSIGSHQEHLAALKHLFDDHSLLLAGFWKFIKVSIKNNKFVQVPKALFSDDALSDYLKFNAHIDPATEEFLYSIHEHSSSVTVFAIHKELRLWLQGLYQNSTVVFTHQSLTLIDGIMRAAAKRQDNPLYIYIDRFKLHILSVQQDKLVYYNQFIIKQFSDYVRYIMLVMKALNMDQSTSQVVLWGYVGKNSPHYHEFYKYISNVSFGDRPSFLEFGYMFDEVQEHHFTDLYGIYSV
ncbi:MAG: DUF3822 family protein [Flammeovirgaceae bacterium]|nr:DUF3822 family protein [Flammeovirgaceae bacterium]